MDRGCTFFAKPSARQNLARTRLTTPSPSVSSVEEPKPAKAQAKTGKKIVVIDDTEMLLIFVEDSLSLADPSLQIVTALTGSEGVRRAETMMPDLVLLDYSLRDLRGDQICERLLQNEATARIPVVMMSGHVPEMMATAERYPNVVATIAKPFMSEALVQLVHETLAKGPLPSAPKEKAAPFRRWPILRKCRQPGAETRAAWQRKEAGQEKCLSQRAKPRKRRQTLVPPAPARAASPATCPAAPQVRSRLSNPVAPAATPAPLQSPACA